MRALRVGIVCPYSFDEPGGVQAHTVDLARALVVRGHHARVLAPADPHTALPDLVDGAGGSVAVPYNGSVARLAHTPATAERVEAWLDAGRFDLVHLHEPLVPSLSMQALRAATAPTVATFHAHMERSRALEVAGPLVVPLLDRLTARIAVSEQARRTVLSYAGGEVVVVPNGVEVGRFVAASPRPAWQGRGDGATGEPTIAFLGRLDEPRKGLPVLARAYLRLLDDVPGARLLIAGGGAGDEARRLLAADRRDPLGRGRVEFLGRVSEQDKETLLASADVYVAPQTGGESFGIVLVEALAAGARVVASDIPAFRAVLDDGRAGELFAVGDEAALAAVLGRVVSDRAATGRAAHAARARADGYDWSTVTTKVLAVYETAIAVSRVEPPRPPLVERLRRRWRRDGRRP